MSAKWTAEGWRRPEVERARPLARPRPRTMLGCVLVWVGVSVACWGAFAAYVLGWLS